MTDLVRQELQNYQFLQIFFHFWSTVVLDRGPTDIRAPCKAYQAIELLAFLRVIAQSRIGLDHVRILVLPTVV